MRVIKITSKLSPKEQRRLRYRAQRMDETDDRGSVSFTHLAPLTYTARMPQYPDSVAPNLHAVARRMMLAAGVTFNYDIEERS